MGIFSFFGSKNNRLTDGNAEQQRSQEQRNRQNDIYVNVVGNSYQKQDISLDYQRCYDYYHNVTALYVAVDKISRDSSKIKITEIDSDDEITDIFLNSNDSVVRAAINSLLLTGNIVIRVFGKVGSEVSKMQVLSPNFIDFSCSGIIEKPSDDKFEVGNIIYTYDVVSGVFVANDGLSFIHVIKNDLNHTRFGTPTINNLVVKLDWIIEYEKRQTNNVTTGVNANKIIGIDSDGVDQEQLDTFQSKYKNGGGRNTVMWAPFKIGGSVDISGSSVDLETYNKYEQAIYNNFHIPVPLMSQTSQTFSNFAESIDQYQEEAIIPNLELLKEGLNFIIRTGDKNFVGFDFKPTKEARTLQRQRLEAMKVATENNALTINEVRDIGGYKEMEGGDVLDNDNGFGNIILDNEEA